MAVTLNIIFLILLVGVPTAIAAGLFAGIAYLLRVRRWYMWALAAPLLAIGFLVVYYHLASDPNQLFQNEFGFAVAPPVVVYQAQSWALGDSGQAFLHFHADAPTVQRIVAGWSAQGQPTGTNVQPPSWWRPRLGATQQYFQQLGYGNAAATTMPVSSNFAAEDRWLIYDPSSGEVWYRFLGVD